MKVFVTLSDDEGWAHPRFSVVWNESAYMVKTFLHCGWAADIVLEGTCVENEYGDRTLKNVQVLEGADHPSLLRIISYLRGS